MKRYLILILALLLLLSCFAGCKSEKTVEGVTTEEIPSETGGVTERVSETTPTTPTAPATDPLPPVDGTSWLLAETEDAGEEYQNKMIFLGDSTTAHMIYRGGLPDGEDTAQVWRGEKNTITFVYIETEKILYPPTGDYISIQDAAADAQPEYLVITLGVTGGVSSNLKEESFKKLYTWLLDSILEVSPRTTIIVQSIYPVNKVNEYEKTITNGKIRVYNEYVKDVVKEFHGAGKRVFFANTYEALLDDEGYMKEEYGNGDGLHISEEGYAVILHYLRTHAVVLQ